MDKRVEIGNNIKELVRTSKKKKNQIAFELDISEPQLYVYMRGQSVPGGLMIIELCRVLNCTYEEILGKP